MITCKLFAQLGNQAFMISATIAHSLRMNTSYAFPKFTTAPRIWRTYFIDLPLIAPNQSTKDYYKESSPRYNKIPESNDMTLEGYWQSEKYFSNYKKQLAEVLGFEYKPSEFVAIHVRRGDYLRYPDQFPVLPTEYYKLSILGMLDRGYTKFKVFSDDTNWCEQVLLPTISPNWKINFSICKQGDPVSAMRDLFNAQAFIIANSTFSLFPALLRDDNPLVIAPEDDRWFGSAAKHLNSPDRLPERFIKI